MKGLIRAGISIYLAIICIIVLNLIFGTGGILSYKELNAYKKTMSLNIYELNDINSGLILDSDKLMHQSNEVRLQARELGWVGPNEGFIIVKGFNQGKNGYSMGKLMSHDKGHPNKNHSSLIIAFLVGLSYYIFSGFFIDFKFRK